MRWVHILFILLVVSGLQQFRPLVAGVKDTLSHPQMPGLYVGMTSSACGPRPPVRNVERYILHLPQPFPQQGFVAFYFPGPPSLANNTASVSFTSRQSPPKTISFASLSIQSASMRVDQQYFVTIPLSQLLPYFSSVRDSGFLDVRLEVNSNPVVCFSAQAQPQFCLMDVCVEYTEAVDSTYVGNAGQGGTPPPASSDIQLDAHPSPTNEGNPLGNSGEGPLGGLGCTIVPSAQPGTFGILLMGIIFVLFRMRRFSFCRRSG